MTRISHVDPQGRGGSFEPDEAGYARISKEGKPNEVANRPFGRIRQGIYLLREGGCSMLFLVGEV
jgi:hypothetical protein